MKGYGKTLGTIKRRKWWPLLLGVVVVLLFCIMLIEGISNRAKMQVDTSQGLEIIKAAEEGDVTAVELKIQSLDAQSQLGGDRSLKEIFASAVIMGDSMALGFAEYDVLNASSVVADAGVSLTDLDEQIKKVKEINPQYIFMTYGLNDVVTTKGDEAKFAEQYKSAVKQIQTELPNTRIFVNSLFTVQSKAAEKEAVYEKIEKYNQALQALCDEQQIGFIDNTVIVENSDYEEDGIHLKSPFYPRWAVHMAEVTSL